MKFKFFIITFLSVGVLFLIYYINFREVEFLAPVKGATKYSYSQNDFLSPRDGHKHKGIDIFAKIGTPVISATKGIVVYTGVFKLGGNVVLIMDPHFRYHYYAHLSKIETKKYTIVNIGDEIGKVGITGNASKNGRQYTPSHLHYSIANPFKFYNYDVKGAHYTIPYLNPIVLLNEYFKKNNLIKS